MLSTLVEEKVAKIYKTTFLQKLMQLLLAKNNKPYVLRCTNVKNIESEVLILHPDVLGLCWTTYVCAMRRLSKNCTNTSHSHKHIHKHLVKQYINNTRTK